MAAGENATAVQSLMLVQYLEPAHVESAEMLERLAQADPYEAALELDRDLCNHTDAYVFAAPVVNHERAESMLRDAIAENPQFAPAHAALGNLLGRLGRLDEGLASYATAVALDPTDASVRLGYAQRLRLHGDQDAAHEQFRRALKDKRLYEAPAKEREELRVLELSAPDFWESNIALDLVVDRAHVSRGKYYLGGAAQLDQWENAVLFNAIADPENVAALEAAEQFVAGQSRRCLNAPALLSRTRREFLSETEPLHESAILPRTIRVAAAELRAQSLPLPFPFLVRPIRSHRGDRLALISHDSELEPYALRDPREKFFVTKFVDYRSRDGWYRKYRFIFIGGRPYAYHLAISPNWMVHYFSAPMAQHAALREEEAFFLERPFEVFGDGLKDALDAICRAIGLDYFGLDCSIVEGELLVFEANANMLVHHFDEPETFGYKRDAFAAIRKALDALLRGAAS